LGIPSFQKFNGVRELKGKTMEKQTYLLLILALFLVTAVSSQQANESHYKWQADDIKDEFEGTHAVSDFQME
jgi:hypothetical protein